MSSWDARVKSGLGELDGAYVVLRDLQLARLSAVEMV